MPHPERELDVVDLVVEVDARRAPHHDLFGLVALEKIEGVAIHSASCRGIAVLMVDDPAAKGRTADCDVVEAEEVEDCGNCLHQVRGTQYVAAQIQHDGVPLGGIARRR